MSQKLMTTAIKLAWAHYSLEVCPSEVWCLGRTRLGTLQREALGHTSGCSVPNAGRLKCAQARLVQTQTRLGTLQRMMKWDGLRAYGSSGMLAPLACTRLASPAPALQTTGGCTGPGTRRPASSRCAAPRACPRCAPGRRRAPGRRQSPHRRAPQGRGRGWRRHSQHTERPASALATSPPRAATTHRIAHTGQRAAG